MQTVDPVEPRPRVARRVAAVVIVLLLLIVPPVLREPSPAPCPDGAVWYQGGCIAADHLTILAREGQSRTDIEAAVAPYGGVVDDRLRNAALAGVYGVDFPPGTIVELDQIRAGLEAAGFDASLSPLLELFASY
jgi:hypothetical protein